MIAVHRYPAISEHRTEHAQLAQQVAEFKNKHDAGMLTISVFLLHFLMEWLTHHGLESDKALAQSISNH